MPLAQVVETMRPLPVVPVAGAPEFVLGISIIRGAPVPVVDGAALLGADAHATRLVIVRIDGRQVALAVDEVLGARPIGRDSLRVVPPLLREARGDAVSSIGSLDAELLLFLEAVRILPDAAWKALERAMESP